MRKSILNGLLCMVIISILGCSKEAPTPTQRRKRPARKTLRFAPAPYSLQVVGRNGVVCKNVKLHWGDLVEGFGWVGPGSSASVSTFVEAVPYRVTMTWITEDESHIPTADDPEAQVDYHRVTARVPRAPDGKGYVRYIFIMLPDNKLKVTVLRDEKYHDIRNWGITSEGAPAYSMAIKNDTRQSFTYAEVKLGKYIACLESNELDPFNYNNGWRFVHILPFQITKDAHVNWTTSDGERHSAVVPLQGQLPENIDGQTLCFVIRENHQVDLFTHEWEQRENWMKETF